jgi:hypothetical protein
MDRAKIETFIIVWALFTFASYFAISKILSHFMSTNQVISITLILTKLVVACVVSLILSYSYVFKLP